MTELFVTIIGITFVPKFKVMEEEAFPEITPDPSTVSVAPPEADEGVIVICLVAVVLV